MSVILDKEYTPALPASDTAHRVLRNTYWLLALAMLPAVLGAIIGVAFAIPVPRGLFGFFLFLGAFYGFMYAIEKTKDTGAGILVLFGFTFFLGIWLTPLLTRTLGFSNGGTLIMLAFGGTATILATMATIATVSKRDFSMLGKWLSMGMIVVLLAAVVGIVFQLPMLLVALSAVCVLIFSAYILYDVQQIVNGGETNYIRAATHLFLDVWMIFSNLLALAGIGGNRD
jgi:modulator of FtsH protease